MTAASAASDVLPPAPSSRGLTAIAARRFVRNRTAIAAFAVLAAIFIAGALASTIAPDGWNVIDLSPAAVHRAPQLAGWHLFGTDALGRDVLVRTLYATRTTEEVALAASVIATVVGVMAGTLAGYFRGWTDAVVMRLADLVTAYPPVILALAAIVYLHQAYPRYLILIFSAYMWAVVARVVRAHVIQLRELEYVDAARAVGASDTHILRKHLLPNLTGTILVAATSLVGQIVLIDATVEFFNYGLPASTSPSLGNLIADVVQFKFGLSNEVVTAAYGWWTWFFPATILAIILVCLNFVGDALDEALNPSIGTV